MGNGRDGWLSPDRIERRDTFRRMVRRLAGAADIDQHALGPRVGHSPSRWRDIMTTGAPHCLAVADLAILCEILGSDELLESIARARGYRLVRDVRDEQSRPTDTLEATARVMTAAGQLVSTTTGAVASGGISPISARAISNDCDGVRRAVNQLEAAVSVNVVEPQRSSGR